MTWTSPSGIIGLLQRHFPGASQAEVRPPLFLPPGSKVFNPEGRFRIGRQVLAAKSYDEGSTEVIPGFGQV